MLQTLFAGAYVGALISAGVATPLVVGLARRWGVVDLPNSRKVHQQPTPRLGGLAIAASMISVALIALLLSRLNLDRKILVVGFAAVFVLIVGVFDDLLNLPSKFKLFALIAASIAVCGIGARIDTMVLHGDVILNFGWFAWPVTILWLVGITVSINFIDGLDGLAAGISAIACAVIAVTASWSGQPVLAVIALALLGSLTGFLFFNFNPAKVFMGDGGSMFIGFSLASLGILQAPRVGTTVGLMLPVLALSVPILDTLLTLIRRGVIQRGSVFAAERGHIHHRLLDLGLCQRHAVLILYAASLVSAAVGLLALLDHGWPTLAGLTLLLPLLVGLFRTAGSTRVRETISAIRRNRAIGRELKKYTRVFEDLQLRFRHVPDFDGWWKELCIAADLLDFTKIDLPLTRRDGTRDLRQWKCADRQREEWDTIEASVPIRQRRRKVLLRANVEVASNTYIETAGHRVALFSRLMGDFNVLSLPGTIKRVRARGPAAEKLSPPANRKFNVECGERTNGDAEFYGNGHVGGNGHAKGKCNGNGAHRQPNGSIRTDHQQTATDVPLQQLIDLAGNLRQMPETGIEASLENSDLPSVDGMRHDLSRLKIAVVHDFLYCYAGAERVLEQILHVFPHADLFSLFDFLAPDQRGFIQNKPVQTSFIQRMPLARRRHRAYLPLMPLAIEQLDVSRYDIVISSSYVAAKGVLTRPDQLHISYCHTPVRFAWDLRHQYLGAGGLIAGVKSLLPRLVFHYIRSWDARSANGVDVFITNSAYVGQRIEKIYRRRATTIYPPVDTDRFTLGDTKEDFYLTVSRMVPYKRVDLIVDAFNRMPRRRLIVVGDGPEFDKIKSKAGPNIRLVGHQPFEKLKKYMQLAQAFIFAAEEDFGIVPVEAQACGTPVIAFGRGGVTESVVTGLSGIFYQDQTTDSLIAAVEEFECQRSWNQEEIRENAERFSTSRFRTEIRELVEEEWATFSERRMKKFGSLRQPQSIDRNSSVETFLASRQ
jgi:UDP-N-acetylmuramyl pentapeptide phosphotransferase/UDP-N-acetylglucosamine-1-phosphate transferase/glycosyltransferase involved in cell wall biosynthesis